MHRSQQRASLERNMLAASWYPQVGIQNETEEVLLERARKLHPEQSFGPDFPSRFKKA